MRGLAAGLAFLVLAGATPPAFACAVAWTPPPYAEALSRQIELRQNSEQIRLARVVEGRIDGEAQPVRFFRTIVSLDEELSTRGLEFAWPDMCRPNPEPGELVLIYFNRVDIVDPHHPDRQRIDVRPEAVVRLKDNVDPEIGPMLRQAASRLTARAARIREMHR